jgi:hypothetical protein
VGDPDGSVIHDSSPQQGSFELLAVRGFDADAEPSQSAVPTDGVEEGEVGKGRNDYLEQPLNRGLEGQRAIGNLADGGQQLEPAALSLVACAHGRIFYVSGDVGQIGVGEVTPPIGVG